MKYLATGIFALGLLVLAWAGVSVLRPMLHAQPRMASYFQDTTELERLKADTQKASATLASMTGLQGLMQPSALPQTVIAQIPPNKNAPVKSPYPARQLSMIYFGSDYRRAVLDGQMVAEGEALSRGGTVMEVREDRVVIKERAGVRSIVVPQDQLRVGTVRKPKLEMPEGARP